MLHFQNYVPTVFENYTASFEIDKHRIELNMWDTSGKTASVAAPPEGDGALGPGRRSIPFPFHSIPASSLVRIPSWAVLRVWLALPMLWLVSGTGGGGVAGVDN